MARQNVAVATETKELIREVKDDMKEVKEDIKEIKEDVKELKEEVREVQRGKSGRESRGWEVSEARATGRECGHAEPHLNQRWGMIQ
jgi:hypothetical protein